MNIVIRKLDGLESDVSTLKSDVSTLKSDVSEVKLVQQEQNKSLKRLEDKTDTIAKVVIKNDLRLTKLEKEVEDLRSSIH
jgi:outer membrane murein-binding lipoprotein Lpp